MGIPIHYYAKVKMEAIEAVVDYVGGIEFEIPYDMVYDDPAQDLHINLAAGKQVLTGKQVEHLLRFRDRQRPDGEEIRTMMWRSVINEFFNQAVIGNKISNISELYKIATENIKTNYPLSDLLDDFPKLKNLDKNNIVIEDICGRNVNVNGYFMFHVNFDDSEPLLKVFDFAETGENLISAITYINEEMGFKLKLPERWKSKCEVIKFDKQVAFLHKGIFLKYGKGAGKLFTITKIVPPTESNLEEIGGSNEYLYWGKHFAYVWSMPSDVQYPVWQDRDEEDVELARDFEEMMEDLNYIKSHFSLLDEVLYVDEASFDGENEESRIHLFPEINFYDTTPYESGIDRQEDGWYYLPTKTIVASFPNIDTPKSVTVFYTEDGRSRGRELAKITRPYIYHTMAKVLSMEVPFPREEICGKLWFEFEYEDGEKITSQHFKVYRTTSDKLSSGSSRETLQTSSVGSAEQEFYGDDISFLHVEFDQKTSIKDIERTLKKSGKGYTINHYGYQEKCRSTKPNISCDQEGRISLFFDINAESLVDVIFRDSGTKEELAQFGILANDVNFYSFVGFDRNKTYDMVIQGKTEDTWKIDGQYIVF